MSRFAVKVHLPWCKSCAICVEACPRRVFELKPDGAWAARPEDCVGCLQCQLKCPDFAITVEEAPNEN